MSKQRDSKTGLYISEEEANTKDPATWTKERDRRKESRFGADERTQFLTAIYTNLLENAQEIEDHDDMTGLFISEAQLKELFKKLGLEL